MPALVFGSTTFPAAAGAVPVAYEDTATYRRRADGSLDVETRGPGRVRVWSPSSVWLSVTLADALRTALLAEGTTELSGDEVGSPNQTCYIRGIRETVRARGGGPSNRVVQLTVDFVGVDG